MAVGKVVGLHTSDGGVPKLATRVLEVTSSGCIGDRQNDLKHHGGINKAVCLFQAEIMNELVNDGHPISPGSTGENILMTGIPVGEIRPGVRLIFPNVELVITQDAPPCKTIMLSFTGGQFNAISHKKRPNFTRWYAKVSKEGSIRIGDSIELFN